MKIIFFPILTLLLLSDCVKAQSDTSKYNACLNLAPLYDGTPEAEFDDFLYKHFGFAFSAGYTFWPRRGLIDVDDGVDLQSLQGLYFKLGVIARGDWFFVRASYVGSFYNEKGEIRLPFLSQQKTANGFVSAPAFAFGINFKFIKYIEMRLGTQLSYFRRNDNLGDSFLTYEPGLGAGDLSNQLIIELVYKWGSVQKH
jgi:hypothetical protein